MEEYRKTSFLMELVPDIYQFLKGLKPIALIYAVVMGVMITLSLFFQWSFIEFFIEIMMGWNVPPYLLRYDSFSFHQPNYMKQIDEDGALKQGIIVRPSYN